MRLYVGCENFGGRVHLFGVLLHFYKQVLQKFWREGTLLSPSPPIPTTCASMYLFNSLYKNLDWLHPKAGYET